MRSKGEEIVKVNIIKPLYTPSERPMHVIVFASGGGGNLQAAIDLSLRSPHLIKVGLVVTDRMGINAIKIAQKYKIEVLASDFEKACGKWHECKDNPEKRYQYQQAGIMWHNTVLDRIISIEKNKKYPFNFVVLSYHRWIHGNLLNYFADRIINQHAGDLTILDNDKTRKYIGIDPVFLALKKGELKTRTSTFLVREGHDTGEILCQGPFVTYTGEKPVTKKQAWKHEQKQKRKSDWPSLTFALQHIAEGDYGIIKNVFHPAGGNILTFKNKKLSYGGIDLENVNNQLSYA